MKNATIADSCGIARKLMNWRKDRRISMNVIKVLRKKFLHITSNDKKPVKDLECLAIHYPYDYNTVCAVSQRLFNDIDEIEKCLLFSQWLHFDPVLVSERIISEVDDTVVNVYNHLNMEKLTTFSVTIPISQYSAILPIVQSIYDAEIKGK